MRSSVTITLVLRIRLDSEDTQNVVSAVNDFMETMSFMHIAVISMNVAISAISGMVARRSTMLTTIPLKNILGKTTSSVLTKSVWKRNSLFLSLMSICKHINYKNTRMGYLKMLVRTLDV